MEEYYLFSSQYQSAAEVQPSAEHVFTYLKGQQKNCHGLEFELNDCERNYSFLAISYLIIYYKRSMAHEQEE